MFSDFLAFNGLPISKLIHCDLILKSFLITRSATMVSMETSHGFHRIIVQVYSYDCRETIPIFLYDFTIMCIYIYICMYSRLL